MEQLVELEWNDPYPIFGRQWLSYFSDEAITVAQGLEVGKKFNDRK